MYSSFIKSMISCARYYNGHVRNVIGDRVMVVFDKKDCFKNSVNTAILMNSVCKFVINKRIKNFTFSTGIGIDFGKMLITKAGTTRHGSEKEFYRSLVWLGKPANIASKLTDLANKTNTFYIKGVNQGFHYPLTNEFLWVGTTMDDFLRSLETTYTNHLKHVNDYFFTFLPTDLGPYTTDYKPIMMTSAVYNGFKREAPNDNSLEKGLWSKCDINIKDYSGDIYGGNVVFTDVYNV